MYIHDYWVVAKRVDHFQLNDRYEVCLPGFQFNPYIFSYCASIENELNTI